MRRSTTHYRTFTEAYRAHIHLHRHGWPSDALVRKWYGEVCGLKGGVYTNLKDGLPVPDKYAVWFVRLLVGDGPFDHIEISPAENEWLEESRRATVAYLGRFGLTNLTPQHADAVLEHICYPKVSLQHGALAYVDYLRYRIACFANILFKAEYPDWVHGCTAEQIPELVNWIYTRVGHEISPGGRLLDSRRACAVARAYMGIEQSEYCKQAISWKEFNPWTLVRAWHRRAGAVGVSIALPVTDAAYREIAEGRLTPFQCTARHLSPTSLNIVLEAMAEDPRHVGCPLPNPTESLRAASVFQIAALARTNHLEGKGEVRILGFAGTPENEERMREADFVATGMFMRHPNPKTRLALYELTIAVGELISKDFLEAAALDHAGKHLPASPPLGTS